MPSFAEEAYSGENLNVIVLQDKEYDPACMWYIEENHTKKLIKDMGELNMGDYQTLDDFVKYSKTNYPAIDTLFHFMIMEVDGKVHVLIIPTMIC